jgi:SRSO17 transposase
VGRVAAQHQSLLHLVANAPWSDAAVMAKVGKMVLPSIERHGPIEAWIIDDTGFPKKGRHSVGVARQYCGQLGKQDNCQVAVSLSLANHGASLPIDCRLPIAFTCRTSGSRIPSAAAAARSPRTSLLSPRTSKSKNQIALEQIKKARQQGLPQGVVLMDAGYGNNSDLREGITQEGLIYVAGIVPTTTVWAPGALPLPPAPWTGRGRPGKRLRRDDTHQPVSVNSLALQLSQDAWQTIAWREGTNETLSGRFARCRVRPAHRDNPGLRRGRLCATPPARRNGCSSSGRKARPSRLSTGCPRCPRTSASSGSSISPSCAGASSATTRNSSRRSGWDITRGEGGAASTITPRCASPSTAS